MEDAVARFRAASEANDVQAMMLTLAPGAELVSPVSGRLAFHGQDDLRVLLTAVYGTITDLHWREEVGNGRLRVVVGDARIGPLRLGDAMVLELAADGRIMRIRPHLRPWLAQTLFAVMIAPRIARHPGAFGRALR